MLEQFLKQMYENFIKMLGGISRIDPAEDDIRVNILAMRNQIIELLNLGEKPTQTCNDYTPLMLYAHFNITDERFENELTKESEYILKTIKINSDSTLKISALAIAAVSSSEQTLDKLYSTGLFTQQHCEEALFLAASNGNARSVAFFRVRQFDLFKTLSQFPDKTPLLMACINGHEGVVKEIMAAHPTEVQISMRTIISSKTAYDYALERNHDQCVQLLRKTKTALWHEVKKAITDNQQERLFNLLNGDIKLNLVLEKFHKRYESLIGFTAYISNTVRDRDDIYKKVQQYITSSLSPHDEINSYLVGIPYLNVANNDTGCFTGKFVWMMMERLDQLRPHFGNMKHLLIDGLNQSMEIWNIVKEILENGSVQKIDLVTSDPYYLDTVTCEWCTINILPKVSVEFVAKLLANTALIECKLYTNDLHKPVAILLDKIIERNQKISKATLDIMKDKIYNSYVSEINKLVNEIKNNKDISETECLPEISKKFKIYSLTQLAAFYVANTLSSNNNNISLTQDCDNLVDITKFESTNLNCNNRANRFT